MLVFILVFLRGVEKVCSKKHLMFGLSSLHPVYAQTTTSYGTSLPSLVRLRDWPKVGPLSAPTQTAIYFAGVFYCVPCFVAVVVREDAEVEGWSY